MILLLAEDVVRSVGRRSAALDRRTLPAYTSYMEDVKPPTAARPRPTPTPCLCAALRQASRAVTRIYDAELRGTGLRSTQHSLLRLLDRVGEVRQGDLGEMASLDETTLTRNLRPLQKSGWVTIRAGADRREKLVAITEAGKDNDGTGPPGLVEGPGTDEESPAGRHVGFAVRGVAGGHEGRFGRSTMSQSRISVEHVRLTIGQPFDEFIAGVRGTVRSL